MKEDTPTVHNGAAYGDIAKTVLMSGDPLRSQFIADNYLQDAVLYNKIRGMYGLTGTYNGKPVSVQGHGMGIPSIGIYSHELYAFYDVDTIIRIGTCGSFDSTTPLGTVLLVEDAISDSNYGYQFGIPAGSRLKADSELLERAAQNAEAMGLTYKKGTIFSSDVFYDGGKRPANFDTAGCIGVEMEAYGLYANAQAFGKKALTIVTITDNIVDFKGLSPEERQNGLHNMIKLALSLV